MHDELKNIATCPIHDINPMDPEVLKSPWLMNERLRNEAPVFHDRNSGIFFISRYEDVVNMAKDHETFSSRMLSSSRALYSTEDKELRAIMSQGYENVPTMLTEAPPLQLRYRKFVNGAFSPKNLKTLEPYIEHISDIEETTALYPRCFSGKYDKSKCTPSTNISVETIVF